MKCPSCHHLIQHKRGCPFKGDLKARLPLLNLEMDRGLADLAKLPEEFDTDAVAEIMCCTRKHARQVVVMRLVDLGLIETIRHHQTGKRGRPVPIFGRVKQ